MSSAEHPFAKYIRIIGKGKTAARNLSYEESFAAMEMILNGSVNDIQIGAFLMLLRVKEETPEELAGFAAATKEYIESEYPLGESVNVDIDWPSYAGKNKQHPWYLLSMLLLAENKIRVLCHGAAGHTEGRIYTETVFNALKLPISTNFDIAKEQIKRHSLTYLSLEAFCPPLHKIINLRNQFGLRSPVHSFAKLINPCNADASLIGIFHPSYKPVHQEASLILKRHNISTFKGDGGEAEFRPHASTRIERLISGSPTIEDWENRVTEKPEPIKNINIDDLVSFWKNESEKSNFNTDYARETVLGTTALAISTLKQTSPSDSYELAKSMWESRNKNRL